MGWDNVGLMYYNITIVAYHDVCLSKNGECTRKTIVRVGSDVLYIYIYACSQQCDIWVCPKCQTSVNGVVMGLFSRVY